MHFSLTHNAYGKSKVRLTKVTRHDGKHDLKELSVDVLLEGDFAGSYTDGDNSKVVATDSMRNTVYSVAKDHPLADVEGYAIALARHFVDHYDMVKTAQVDVREQPWQRIVVNGTPHAHAFQSGGSEQGTCHAEVSGDRVFLKSGLTDLLVLKTTGSGFSGFVRDRYTTLRETTDRIFATSVTAEWTWNKTQDVDFSARNALIRKMMLEVFAEQFSLAVQQTLQEMAEAALAVCPEIDEMVITMPNKHRLMVNLEPFGQHNANEIFMPTDEPHGLITGTIRRG